MHPCPKLKLTQPNIQLGNCRSQANGGAQAFQGLLPGPTADPVGKSTTDGYALAVQFLFRSIGRADIVELHVLHIVENDG